MLHGSQPCGFDGIGKQGTQGIQSTTQPPHRRRPKSVMAASHADIVWMKTQYKVQQRTARTTTENKHKMETCKYLIEPCCIKRIVNFFISNVGPVVRVFAYALFLPPWCLEPGKFYLSSSSSSSSSQARPHR